MMKKGKGIYVVVMLVGITVSMLSFNSCSKADIVQPVENPPTKLWVNPETPASFPGGTKAMFEFIKDNLRYPAGYEETDIQGRVIVTFMIEEDGSLSDIKVSRGLDPKFDEEAVRVVSIMPKWTPAKVYGKPIKVRYTCRIDFKLE